MKVAAWTGNWTERLVLLAIAFSVILISWYSTASHMVGILQTVDVFAHGLLAPFVSIVLIWAKRSQLASLDPQVSVFGAVIVVGSSVLWMTGELLDVALFRHVALVAAVQGIVIALLGWSVYRAILFPMLFLFFSVPFGYELVGPLQRTTASMVIAFLDLIGASYTAEGMLISLPSGLYEVAEACAGVKFLFTSVFTGTLLAYLLYETWQKKLLIVSVSIVLPIFANVARVLLIFLIAELSDQALAKGFDHLVYGWVFLSFVLFLLISIAYRFADKDLSLEGGSSADETKPGTVGSRRIVWFVAVTAIAAPVAAVTIVPPTTIDPDRLREPAVVEPLFVQAMPGYRVLPATGLVVQPSFIAADQQSASLLRKAGTVFNVYQASIEALSSGQRLYQPGNALVNQEWRLVSSRKLTDIQCLTGSGFTETIFKRGNDRTIVWSTYQIGDQPVSSAIEEKLQTALFRLQRKPLAGEVFALSAPLQGNIDDIRQIFLEFLSTFAPGGYLTADGGTEQRDYRLCAE